MKSILIVSFALLMSACSTVPENLRVPEGTELTNFDIAKKQPTLVKGQQARWGGIIAGVENKADSSIVEIVHFDLKDSTRPKQEDKTQGRFKVVFKGLLDPMIYQQGRSVTALGLIAEQQNGKIGEFEYAFPVLRDAQIHLWKEIEKPDVVIEHDPFFYHHRYWGYPSYYRTGVVVVNKQSTKSKKN